MDIRNYDQLFDLAIKREEEAAAFYDHLASISLGNSMRELLKSFADEERSHKAHLERLRVAGRLPDPASNPLELQVEEVDALYGPGSEDLTLKQALELARQRENAAFRLYSQLAAKAHTEELRKGFAYMAEQEARHKTSFDSEYGQLFGSA